MLIRRRPLLRAAAVGGIGYASYRAGKSAAAQAAPQQAIPASQTEKINALTELKSLLDSGAVTQAEFDRAKKGLLKGDV
jgi:hypothetical protein